MVVSGSPSTMMVNCVMEYFEKDKDVDCAEAFLEILKKAVENVEVEVFESLIRNYASAGRTSPSMRHRLKMENVEVNEACKKLLDVVCVDGNVDQSDQYLKPEYKWVMALAFVYIDNIFYTWSCKLRWNKDKGYVGCQSNGGIAPLWQLPGSPTAIDCFR
ncbi:hypothetical protein Ancab_023505 [Ancistrocladus abbreviatus]